MLHLPIERLAELVDGGATAPEQEHLTTCLSCTRELEAYRRLVSMASDERRSIAPPLTDWGTLSQRLRSEGLLVGAAPERPRVSATVAFFQRAAAVILFLGGGAVLGRMSAGMSVPDAVTFRSASTIERLQGGAPGNTQFASNPADAFPSADAALEALEQAQRQYAMASTYLSVRDTNSSEASRAQYRTRLAALDQTAETMQQAMREAPSDPYINQYYLATLSAREATLRRLGTTMPVGNRLGRF
ncbi:MAG: hypothetical protein ABIZ91_20255 [Gemmatimonadaceae bacterium]